MARVVLRINLLKKEELQMKLREGNAFTGVSLFTVCVCVCGGGGSISGLMSFLVGISGIRSLLGVGIQGVGMSRG